MPFWPLWLENRGLDSLQIGLLLALGPWVRTITNPVIANISDRSGKSKKVLMILSILSICAFLCFFLAQTFWTILFISIFAAITFPVMLPIAESRVMTSVLNQHLDYGRIRLWGSITFILGTILTGQLLDYFNPNLILILVMAALLITFSSITILPTEKKEKSKYDYKDIPKLLVQPNFMLFVISASLLQASHAVYNGFSAIHWLSSGINESVIGLLWAEGVLAEIILFSLSGFFIARIGPLGLICLAGCVGVIRWVMLGLTTDVNYLLLAQVFHAITFGAVHLGSMHFIARNSPPSLSATAQGVYASCSGLMMGLTMILAGSLFENIGGKSFYAMSAISALGAVLSIFLILKNKKLTSTL
ncbi:MAG: putative 3-phenylpropionic acid transporter [Alphaproteobacteria bacterium MarineAlpha12_Bin1]|jgi:PPP family 3-phenylpropionic acid transporter|nr:MAG: putative 3-phenylpropionic acid transporter [Alphaproteobacteria bacterium MarineAlpha12_Bin1]|tara:strand:- start:1175 stop:2257 length:1083 start_codon:yes stop_codon:yes gene_type:complete